MAYAIQNRLCASVLSTKSFPLSDNYMPETGNTYTLWHQMLVQQMEDKGVKLKNGTIIGAKSGYTEENTSGRCLITHVKGKNNHDYIIVTAKAPTGDPYKDEKWLPATKDLVALCDEYVK